MSRPSDTMPEARMDAKNLYREESFTDRKVGSIRCLTPIRTDGTPDPGRGVVYIGQAQLLTQVGALPLTFDINAKTLEEAVQKYSDAAKEAVERTMKELQEMRREAASSIVVPQGGAGGLGGPGVPGGGKIQFP